MTIEDLLLVIAQMQQQQQPQPPPQYDRGPAATVTDFVRLQPPVFTGEGDPMIAEKWLDQIEKCIEVLKVVDDATYIQLTTFQLCDSAEMWWKSVKDTQSITGMTWKTFKELFLA